ncbi:MAG: hypothetical protein ABSF99_06170 [Anaerolineales bacterium]|jgi:hypothetical protein
MRKLIACIFLMFVAVACASSLEVTSTPTPALTLVPANTSAPTSTVLPSPSPTMTSLPTATFTPTLTLTPRVVRSIDLVAFQSSRNGTWFSTSIDTLPQNQQNATATFDITTSALSNRRDGKIASTLLAGYVFLQWGDVSPASFDQFTGTIGALFIRSAGLSFVDYPNNRVLLWDRKSVNIPMDIRGMIRVCNQHQIPVFLEINYSDYVPGLLGTGVEALQPADNIAGTITYLKALQAEGLHVEGVTFGDEIQDDSGYGNRQPTIYNSDLISRFIDYASALKSEFPDLKVYAFDSYIRATRGEISAYWDLFQKIRQAEVSENKNLLDGFTFRESYTYINGQGQVLDSQRILDDTESLYRDAPVYRYDVRGTTHADPDRDYLHQIISHTSAIFSRTLDILISEYLPAGPIQISETDTSRYADMDFILHYSDIVGIYADLGLDGVSTIMFGDSLNMHKAYFDRQGNKGVNYPIHEQLAKYFTGEILNIDRSTDYDSLKVKVYAARRENETFVMILNKDVSNEHTVQVRLPGKFDLTIRLPRRSYTSIFLDDKSVTVSGIGN